jgi:endo-1,4-beta-D-glucanase Y
MLIRAGDWLWEKRRWGVLVKNNLPDGETCIKVISLSYFSELDGRVSFEEEFD